MAPSSSPSRDLTVDGLKQRLQGQHIPADKMAGDGDFLLISPPGISIKDIRQFLKSAFHEFDELGAMIPDSLPMDGIALKSLEFMPASPSGDPYLLEFTIAWEDARWDMIPGVIALESPELDMIIKGGRVYAEVSGIIEVEGVPILLEVDLPGGLFSARLAIEDGVQQSASGLVQKFHAGPNSGKGIDLGGALTLQDLALLGSIADQRGLFHLALGNIKIGPGEMALQLSLDYTGGANSNIMGSVWGEYDIKKTGTDSVLFSLTLMAEYDGPDQGWLFQGSATSEGSQGEGGQNNLSSISELIHAFDPAASGIPDFLSHLAINRLDLSYHTGSGDFSFSCDVEAEGLFGKDSDIELIVNIGLKRNNPGIMPATYEKTFSGQLLIGLEGDLKIEFDILFDLDQSAQESRTTFIGDYKNLAGGDISIGALTSKLDPDLNIPLTINLKDAFFIYDKKTTDPKANILFGLDIGSGINLSNLPLVGHLFPDSQTLKIGIQPLIASGPTAPYFQQNELGRLQALIPGGGIALPDLDINAQVSLAINLQAGDRVQRIDLPIVLNKTAQPLPAGQVPRAAKPIGTALTTPVNPETMPQADLPASSRSNAPVTSADGTKWIDLQQSFGPVQFNRVGFAFSEGQIHAYLDAAIGLAGLTLSLDGLGMSTPVNKFDPTFSLNGLGLDYSQGPLEIGGSFLRTEVTTGPGAPYDEYDGMAVLKMEIFSVSAIGSYARVNGQHSLFLYAVLNYPLGGPPFFFVTGLAAGFGYNRALRVPAIAEVAQFPLVNEAVNGAGSGPPGDVAGRRQFLQTELTSLRNSIYPAPENFLAAGIRYTSFEMLDSFALVTVSFGQNFEVDVLGLTTLAIPTPEVGQIVTPVAEAQLAVKAALNPDEGVLSIEAQLTNNSYLFSRACHLTGGFAFYTWFKGEHEGDFVISLGGYNPEFIVPKHYPTVPRLGFNWILTSNISLKGEVYFALTAHAIMAGGKLEALFDAGDLKAWFLIGADFILYWKPYFYDAHLYLGISVSFTFHLFGSHTISASIDADLHIWGPDFSGIATIHLWIVSFTVNFGDASPEPRPIDWTTFQHSFLPDAQKVCTATVAGGLVKEEGKRAVLNPKGMALLVNSMAPVKTFELGLNGISNNDQLYYADTGYQIPLAISEDARALNPKAAASFGIAPMDLQSLAVSRMEISIKRDGSESVNSDFAFTPVLKRMPRAMWGDKMTVETNGEKFIEDALTGFVIRPAKPVIPGETHLVSKKNLQYEVDHRADAFSCPKISSCRASGSDSPDLNTFAARSARRNGLLEGLGFNLNALNLSAPNELSSIFVQQPLTSTFS